MDEIKKIAKMKSIKYINGVPKIIDLNEKHKQPKN